jgi:hypothetical protein
MPDIEKRQGKSLSAQNSQPALNIKVVYNHVPDIQIK